MRGLRLMKDSASDGVTVLSNAANQPTPILRVTVPKSRIFVFPHNGSPILKLFTAAAAEVAATSRIVFTVRKPSDTFGADASNRISYQAWKSTPLTSVNGEQTQYNVETTAQRRVLWKIGDNLQVSQDYIVELMLTSPDIVDWTQAGSVFEWDIAEGDVATQVAVGFT